MKRVALLVLGVLAVCAETAPRREPPPAPTPVAPTPTPVAPPARSGTVVVGCPGGAVTCDVASTFALRAAGLSGRAAVPPGTGMLFLYSEADTRSFWMKGCLVPLDIAYVRDDGVVVDVGRLEAPPRGVDDDALPRFRSTQPVRVVFEAAAGEFARLGVVPGVTLRLPDGLAARFADADP